jgi:hypothetical protein
MADLETYERFIVDRMDEAGGFTFVYFDELYEQWRSDDNLSDFYNHDRMKLYCIRDSDGQNPEYCGINYLGQEFPYPQKPLEYVKEAIDEGTTTLGWGAVTFLTRPCSIEEASAEWRQQKMEEINLARRAAYNNYWTNEDASLVELVRQALVTAVEEVGQEPDSNYDEQVVLSTLAHRTSLLVIDLSGNSYNSYDPSLLAHPTLKPKSAVQTRVATVMIEKAVADNLACPITLNPLTAESAACVAPCYHVFDKEAIRTWLQTNNTCPECRTVCSL